MALSELGIYHPELGQTVPQSVEKTVAYSSPDTLTQTALDSLNSKHVVRIPHWRKDFGSFNPTVGAREDLVTLGAKDELVDTLFSHKGEWIYKDEQQEDIYGKSPEEAYQYVTSVLSPVYEAVTVYLDEPTLISRPYNAHNEAHARSVKEGGNHLLTYALNEREKSQDLSQSEYTHYDDDTKLAFYVAAAIHDIGYVLSEEHSHASVALAKKIMPQLTDNPVLWSRIERAVMLHETGEVREEMKSLGITKPSEVVKQLKKEDPIVLALRDIDKLDRTRKRVRGGEVLRQKAMYFAKDTEVVNFLEDPHVESHLLLPVKSADWIHEKDSDGIERVIFRVESEFQQEVDGEEQEDLLPYVKKRNKHEGHKIAVARSTRKAFENGHVDYFDTIVEKTLDIEAKRMLLTIYDSFALNPNQDAYELVFSDPDRVKSIKYVFSRETLDLDVESFWNKEVPEKRRNTRAPEDLKL